MLEKTFQMAKKIIDEHTKITLALFLVVTFLFTIGVWSTPILLKGYPAIQPEWHMIIAARNYAQNNVLGSEDKLNIVRAPSEVSNSVQMSSLGNKLTSLVYGWVFRWLNQPVDWQHIYFIAIIFSAFAAVFFTLTVYLLFGWKAALLFPAIYALLPFNGELSQFIGTYEFTLLFFSLFSVIYFGWPNAKSRLWLLPLAGIFLALAGLAREAMYVFLPILGVWLAYKRKWQELVLIFLPAVIVITGLPFIFGWQGNDYLKLVANQEQSAAEAMRYSDFDYYSHLYPDPYTYHFNRQEYLEKFRNSLGDVGFLERINLIKSANNMGEMSINLWQRLIIGSDNLLAHLMRFFSLAVLGGPIVLALILFGWWQLRGKQKDLFYFSIWWAGSLLIMLSFGTLVIRNHLMDFGWLLAALAALGLAGLWPIIKNNCKQHWSAWLVFTFIIFSFLYTLLLIDHVYWGQAYDKSSFPTMVYLSDQIKNYDFTVNGGEGVIAAGCRDGHNFFNFFTQKNFVYFDLETIQQLAQTGKLAGAFDDFGVKYIACFDQTTSDLITSSSQARNIVVWPEVDLVPPLSAGKSFWLNLVR